MKRASLIAGLILLVTGCSGDDGSPSAPGTQNATSFAVEVPAQVTHGQPFPLTINAVAADGTTLVDTIDGVAFLGVSEGTVSPDSVVVTGGSATVQVTVRTATAPEIGAARAAPISITVSGMGLTGSSVEIDVLPAATAEVTLWGGGWSARAYASAIVSFTDQRVDNRDDVDALNQTSYTMSFTANAAVTEDSGTAMANSSVIMSGSYSVNSVGGPLQFQAEASGTASTQIGSLDNSGATASGTGTGSLEFSVSEPASFSYQATGESQRTGLQDISSGVAVYLARGPGSVSGRLEPGRKYRVGFLLQAGSDNGFSSESLEGSLSFSVF